MVFLNLYMFIDGLYVLNFLVFCYFHLECVRFPVETALYTVIKWYLLCQVLFFFLIAYICYTF